MCDECIALPGLGRLAWRLGGLQQVGGAASSGLILVTQAIARSIRSPPI